MVRADATPPQTDGPAGAVAATGCFLSWWWWLIVALLLVAITWWAIVPWWRARPAPTDPVLPLPAAGQPVAR
jgi:hypothetical protein